MVRAVARWSTRPTPAALLAARLARGWRPQASPLVGGPQVLGYAACWVEPGNSTGGG